jgi:hypothetical protein
MQLFGRKSEVSASAESTWYGYDESFPDQASSEQRWGDDMARLAQSTSTSSGSGAHCVSCWYEEHSEPFPAQDSSSLCERHGQATRMTRAWS